jgi:hypothetical protein
VHPVRRTVRHPRRCRRQPHHVSQRLTHRGRGAPASTPSTAREVAPSSALAPSRNRPTMPLRASGV